MNLLFAWFWLIWLIGVIKICQYVYEHIRRKYLSKEFSNPVGVFTIVAAVAFVISLSAVGIHDITAYVIKFKNQDEEVLTLDEIRDAHFK